MKQYDDYTITDVAQAELIKRLLEAVEQTTERKYAKKRKQLEDTWFKTNLDRLIKGWSDKMVVRGSTNTCRNGGGRRKLLEDLMAAGCEILGVDVVTLDSSGPQNTTPAHQTVNGEPALTPIQQAVVDARVAQIVEGVSGTSAELADDLENRSVERLLENNPDFIERLGDVLMPVIARQIKNLVRELIKQ